jgi:hypothetical protein
MNSISKFKKIVLAFTLILLMATFIPQQAHAISTDARIFIDSVKGDVEVLNTQVTKDDTDILTAVNNGEKAFFRLRDARLSETDPGRKAAITNDLKVMTSYLDILRQNALKKDAPTKSFREGYIELTTSGLYITCFTKTSLLDVTCAKEWYALMQESAKTISSLSSDSQRSINSIQDILDRNDKAGNLTSGQDDASKKAAAAEVGKDLNQQCFPGQYSINMQVCVRSIIGWLAYTIITVLSFLLYLGGQALDFAIKFSVLDITKNIGQIKSIDTIWRLFRDIANLSFIFILLYVAIMTILQSNGSAAARTLKQIVIAAIFINFSLFIAKVVIDTSNIVTLAFYHQLVPTETTTISARFMQALGVSNIFKNGSGEVVNGWAQSWSVLLSSTIGIGMTIFAAAFSFLAAAWLFIIRFVVIIVILIVSPIAFVGTLLPKTSEYATRWWKALIGQALFPPLYMLFVWIAISVGGAANPESFLSQAGNTTEPFTGGFNSIKSAGTSAFGSPINGMGVFIRYIIMIILLNVALTVAKTQADKSGKRVSSWTDWGIKKVDNLRQGAKGAGGYVLREGIPLTTKDGKGFGIGKLRLKTLGGFGSYARQKEKDLANISGDRLIAGNLIGNTRVGNWVRSRTIGAVAESKFGTGKTAKQYKDDGGKIAGKQKEIVDKQRLSELIALKPTLPADIQKRNLDLDETLDRMSNTQLTKMKASELTRPHVLERLDSGQFTALMNAPVEDLNDGDKAAIKKARLELLESSTKPGPAGLTREQKDTTRRLMNNISANDLKRIPERVFGTLTAGTPAGIPNTALINVLKQENLKNLQGLSDETRHMIGIAIDTAAPTHPLKKYINDAKNKATWLP